MLDTTGLVVGALNRRLVARYRNAFGARAPDHAPAITAAVRLALERIATSDAPYHDVDHTVMVTLVGTDILRGRQIEGPLSPDDWLHTTTALLCHDVGYVRGACRGDTATEAVVDAAGSTVVKVILETAALTPDEIVEACRRAEAAGAHYVKTSTGFHPAGGASAEAVALMRETVGDRLGVKASGGIRSLEAAQQMLDAGASRLGLSGTQAILDQIAG